MSTAQQLCGDLSVQIVSGYHFLGVYLGDHSVWMQYVCKEAKVCVSHLLSLTRVADN